MREAGLPPQGARPTGETLWCNANNNNNKAAGQLQAAAVQLAAAPAATAAGGGSASAACSRRGWRGCSLPAPGRAAAAAGGAAPAAGPAGPGPAPARLLQPCLRLPGRRQRGGHATEAVRGLQDCQVGPGVCGSIAFDLPCWLAGSHSASPGFCRYCDAACAKAHWKHHKASCKRVAAAAASAAAGDQQQR